MPSPAPPLPALVRPGREVQHPPAGAGHSRRDFRPDIEGLRAVAVLAVVLFHVGLPGITGGFVGVDVFFVISGFLITGTLWREVQATGTVRLAAFYGARARRLLPAGLLVLVSSAAAAAWLLPPLEARTALVDAMAASVYGANYVLAVRGTDYLAEDALPSPFQHFWSLGVEEQFYLLWPALLIATAAAAWRLGGHRTPGRRSATPFVAVLAALVLVSFAVAQVLTAGSPPWAYFSLPSRAWELGVGGLVALGVPLWRRLHEGAAVVAGLGGLAAVVAGCAVLDESTPFPGTAALIPVLGTALVLVAGCAAPGRGAGGLLSVSPLRYVGRLSYAWYLWHWPVLVLTPHLVGAELPLAARLWAAVGAFGLAIGTLHFVEDPVRFARALRRSAGRSLALGGAATAAGVVAALVILAAVPSTEGTGVAVAAVELDVPADAGAPPAVPVAEAPDPTEVALADLTAQVQSVVAGSVGMTEVPSNLTPALDEARADVPKVFNNGCFLTWTATDQPDCEYGDPASPVSIALVGDSHAAQWVPALQPAAEEHGWRLRLASKVTCPVLDLPIVSPYLGRAYTECVSWRTTLVEELKAAPPTLVVIAMSRRYGADFGYATYDAAWQDSIRRFAADLTAAGSRVLVLGGVPDPHAVVPTCLSSNVSSVPACTPDRATAVNAGGVAGEQQATAAGGGSYADLAPLFCTEAECPLIVGNQLVFRDDNHLTYGYASFLQPVMAALIERELARS
ncbi:acyltransferase family protein [Blastococcus xanthinilyticus]|uniref:Peptidoglycan/LPS O-acetylase OafA/YrhL n=1 Tax=Blastococcus xanthinilyticus TaxID=1564164 RepID=A0A5S5CWD8_9ACTN|nr:acyltransferase family protein [Blastococcus xanthinilyticus]TYP86852.1 peptidoglycan/LPS O-acetylase OafA/YrhL [Blastococcus xanthinilyticus]